MADQCYLTCVGGWVRVSDSESEVGRTEKVEKDDDATMICIRRNIQSEFIVLFRQRSMHFLFQHFRY